MSVLPAQMVIPTCCDVFYHIVNMNIYCNIINVIKNKDSLFPFIIPCATIPTQ